MVARTEKSPYGSLMRLLRLRTNLFQVLCLVVTTTWLFFAFFYDLNMADRMYIDPISVLCINGFFLSRSLGLGSKKLVHYGFPLSLFTIFIVLTYTEGIEKLWQSQISGQVVLVFLASGERVAFVFGVALLIATQIFFFLSPMSYLTAHIVFAESASVMIVWMALDVMHRTAQAAQQKLEKAISVKEVFLAQVSHELRTPLAGVIGYCELLSYNKHDNEEEQSIAGILTCADSALMLINDILSWTSIKSGSPQIENKDFSIRALVAEIEHVCSPIIRKASLDWKMECDPECLETRISSDAKRLVQVVSGLVVNAAKFTQGNEGIATCHVSYSSNKQSLTIVVSDNGRGFVEAEGSHIFEEFFKGSAQKRMGNRGGVGLGLAIAKELVELMGGTVRATSPGLDLGASFTVSVPSQVKDYVPSIPVAQPATSRASAPIMAHRKLSVLLVEDNPVLIRVLSLQLERIFPECSITPASDGLDALAKLSTCQRPFELVVTDVTMPNMDGIELTMIIRHRERASLAGERPNKNAFILGISALTDTHDENNALNCGMDCYLKKPVKFDQLENALSALVGRV